MHVTEYLWQKRGFFFFLQPCPKETNYCSKKTIYLKCIWWGPAAKSLPAPRPVLTRWCSGTSFLRCTSWTRMTHETKMQVHISRLFVSQIHNHCKDQAEKSKRLRNYTEKRRKKTQHNKLQTRGRSMLSMVTKSKRYSNFCVLKWKHVAFTQLLSVSTNELFVIQRGEKKAE